jgi:hypothetical protein
VWVKRTGNSLPEFYDGRSVKIDLNGNPYVLGIFEGSADFDPGTGISNESSLGDFDIFVWGLYSNGTFMFSKSVGGTGKEVSSDLHLDDENNIYFTGFFTAQVDFNPWIGINLIAPASSFADFHINKWGICVPNGSTVIQNSCNSTFVFNGQTYTSSGTYTQTFTNAGGCDSIVTLQLTLTNIDTAVVVNGATIAASQNGAGYQWYICNGSWSPIPNAMQQSFTAMQNGYYASVITLNGCSDTTSCIQIIGLGLNQLTENYFCKIYPNPSSGEVYIDWNTVQSKATIGLYNGLGQLIKEFNSSGELQTVIHLNMPSGFYILKVVTLNGEMEVPLVIQ